MNGTGVYDFKLEYTFAGDYMAELDRQLALLLSTREGTMPLDREFGLNMDVVDMPREAAKSYTRRRSRRRWPSSSQPCGSRKSPGAPAHREI